MDDHEPYLTKSPCTWKSINGYAENFVIDFNGMEITGSDSIPAPPTISLDYYTRAVWNYFRRPNVQRHSVLFVSLRSRPTPRYYHIINSIALLACCYYSRNRRASLCAAVRLKSVQKGNLVLLFKNRNPE